jgi:hypothetical protein
MRPGNPKITGTLYRPTASRRAAPQQQRTISLFPLNLKIESREDSRDDYTVCS